MDSLATGFAPVGCAQPKVLVLGSLPGLASIKVQQYYGHPRNQFWPIIEAITGEQHDTYIDHVASLDHYGIMLWDVVHSAHRQGSLDSNIERPGLRVNDFSFVVNSTCLELIAFNGAAAEKLFKSHVLDAGSLKGLMSDQLPAQLPAMLRMPSTSPANASQSFEQKLSKWKLLSRYVQTA